jgi:hypothetical protein
MKISDLRFSVFLNLTIMIQTLKKFQNTFHQRWDDVPRKYDEKWNIFNYFNNIFYLANLPTLTDPTTGILNQPKLQIQEKPSMMLFTMKMSEWEAYSETKETHSLDLTIYSIT